MSHRTNTLRLARGDSARPFTGTALDVTLRACDRNVPDPVYRLALPDHQLAGYGFRSSQCYRGRQHRGSCSSGPSSATRRAPVLRRTTPGVLGLLSLNGQANRRARAHLPESLSEHFGGEVVASPYLPPIV